MATKPLIDIGRAGAGATSYAEYRNNLNKIKKVNRQITRENEASAKKEAANAAQKSAANAAQKAATPKATETNTNKAIADFKDTDFYKTANIPALQEQLANLYLSPDEARNQARALYEPEYNMQKTAFQNQLSELNTSRNRDIQKINNQYDRSLNSVMAGLNKRNMGRSSLVSTKGVENENARNAAVSETSYNYLTKQNEINANIQQADAQFAQSVENKSVELMNQRQSERINLMAQIAQLQQNSYSAYMNYLLNKEQIDMDNAQMDIKQQQSDIDKQALDLKRQQLDLERQRMEIQYSAKK